MNVDPFKSDQVSRRSFADCQNELIRDQNRKLVPVPVGFSKSLTEIRTFLFIYFIALVVLPGTIPVSAQIRTFNHPHPVLCVDFSPDGTQILTGSGRYARLWDLNSGAEIHQFTLGDSVYTYYVTSLSFSPDGSRVVLANNNGSVCISSAVSGNRIILFSAASLSSVNSVVFSPDGAKVLTGINDHTAKLWDAVTGNLLRTFSGHTTSVTSVAFSPDGTRVLTGSNDCTAKLWETASGELRRTLITPGSSVYSVAYSPSGEQVLTGGFGLPGTRLWGLSTGDIIQTYISESSRSARFSPDGSKILTGGQHGAYLWAKQTGALIHKFSPAKMGSVAFSPDGTKVLTGDYNGNANV